MIDMMVWILSARLLLAYLVSCLLCKKPHLYGGNALIVQVNPITAYAMVEMLAVPKGEYLLQTAANSALGRQVIALAKDRGIKTINVVRKAAQEMDLKALG